jgi:hypothetical protein
MAFRGPYPARSEQTKALSRGRARCQPAGHRVMGSGWTLAARSVIIVRVDSASDLGQLGATR